MKNIHHYLHAGYTHYLKWEEFIPSIKTHVTKGFATTTDALQIRLNALYKDANVSNVEVIVIQKGTV